MYAAKILNRWNTKQVAFEHIFVGAVFFLFWNPCAAKFHTSHTCTFEAIRELGIWQHHCDPCFPHHPTGFCGPAVICPVVLGRDWHGKLQFNCLWWKSLFKYQWFHFFNLFVLAWCHQTRFRLTHMAVCGQSPASKSNPGFGIQCVYVFQCMWLDAPLEKRQVASTVSMGHLFPTIFVGRGLNAAFPPRPQYMGGGFKSQFQSKMAEWIKVFWILDDLSEIMVVFVAPCLFYNVLYIYICVCDVAFACVTWESLSFPIRFILPPVKRADSKMFNFEQIDDSRNAPQNCCFVWKSMTCHSWCNCDLEPRSTTGTGVGQVEHCVFGGQQKRAGKSFINTSYNKHIVPCFFCSMQFKWVQFAKSTRDISVTPPWLRAAKLDCLDRAKSLQDATGFMATYVVAVANINIIIGSFWIVLKTSGLWCL